MHGPSYSQTGALIRFLRQPRVFITGLHEKYGDTFASKFIGDRPWVFFSSPEATRAIFALSSEVMTAGASNEESLGALLGSGGVFTADGQVHLARRKLMLPSFNGERMHAYAGVMTEIARNFVPPAGEFSLLPVCQQMTLDVIMRAVLGLQDDERGQQLRHWLSRVATEVLNSPLLFFTSLQWDLGRLSPWGRTQHILRQTDVLLYAEIAARREREPGDDILSLLMAARDEQGEPLSDLALRNEMITLLIAGHETTATSLAWLFGFVLTERGLLQRVRDEVSAAGSNWKATPLLDATIKESMRLRPILVTSTSRRALQDLDIAGTLVKKGSEVAVSNFVLQRRAELYPDPERFLPERFIGSEPNPSTWAPFGGGLRRCLGLHFALFEMKVLAATMLTHFNLRAVSTTLEDEVRGFFLAPKKGLMVTSTPVR